MDARPLRNQMPAQRALGLVADENRMRAYVAQVVLGVMEDASVRFGHTGTGDEDAAPCNSTCIARSRPDPLSVPSEPGYAPSKPLM